MKVPARKVNSYYYITYASVKIKVMITHDYVNEEVKIIDDVASYCNMKVERVRLCMWHFSQE